MNNGTKHRLYRPRPFGLKSKIKHTDFGSLKFEPLPDPTGNPPFHLSLEDILDAEHIKAIKSSSKLVFHTVGDTGNYLSSSEPQEYVADAMEADIEFNSNSSDKPSFFYHLGDVVYFKGQADQYYPQFYKPYVHYQAPEYSW